MISPALDAFPEEARYIGLMVVGYSDLDITLCHVGGLALGIKWAVLDALHQIRDEGTRIDVVNKLARPTMIERNLETKFGEAVGAIRFCKSIRNQYAHVQWNKFAQNIGGLSFANTRDIEWNATGEIKWLPVDLPLLVEQEAYFEYTRKCLIWLESVLIDSSKETWLQFPTHKAQPRKHNRPDA